MADLVAIDPTIILDELVALGLTEPGKAPPDLRVWRHPGDRELSVISDTERYDLAQANAWYFGIARWHHASVSVVGQLQARLADQKRIGRQRAPGERSPAPLPDWYDLTHIAYQHAGDIGFNPEFPVWQFLPANWMPALNIAEALHLRQPA